jgi:integrase/recombinase XerD
MSVLPNYIQVRNTGMILSAKAVLAWRPKDDGDHALLLQVILDRKRITFPLGCYISAKDFGRGKVLQSHPNHKDINLVIERQKSKVIEIWSRYHLMDRALNAEILRREFHSVVNRHDFHAFAEKALAVQKLTLDFRTWQQNKFALEKLKRFISPMLFSDLSEEMIIRYEAWEEKTYGNIPATIAKTLITWKKYLRIAKKEGILFKNPFEQYKIRKTKSHKVALSKEELATLFEYFHKPDCPEAHKHVLRYFLFSCRTGLRISDITRLTWEHIHEHNIIMPMYKNRKRKKKMINMPITAERELLPEYNAQTKTIFDCYADAVTNRLLKDIARDAKIKKKITYHMSRHTFATTFLEGGGSVEVLQDLMDHEDIGTTMIYSHMTDKRKREQKEKAFS